MATLLCSLLIGAGYDAYVVYGYAIADVTRNYQGRTDCPIPYDVEEVEEKPPEDTNIKYQLKPPRDLRSQFYVMLEQKEIEKAAAEVAREAERRRLEIEELERAEPDKLEGMRVHGWAIILGGTDIEEPFFIEPSTGIAHKVDTNIYCGLEAIWNDRNYWVNLQNCSTGLSAIDWTLSNTALWEHLLPGENKTRTEEKGNRRRPGEDDPDPLGQLEKHLDMPTSWCERIQIPFTMFEKRFPGGKKNVRYRCCRAYQYGEYLQMDGLISRITLFFDYELTEPTFSYELYSHRSDGLYKSKRNLQTDLVVDYFKRGRDDAVREHHYNIVETSVEAKRTLEFYWQCRVDGLVHLEMSPMHMRQVFIGRDDRLLERIVRFEERDGTDTTHRRNVANVIEKFDRDPSKKANDDIRVCEYALDDNEYRLKYHYEKDQITSSTRDFIKPSVSEMGDRLTFNPDKTSGYEANMDAKPPRQLLLFRLLVSLLEREDKSLYLIRIQEDEVLAFLRLRAIEHAVPRLTVSLYHPERNVAARRGIQQREQKAREQSAREVDVETDYLAPQLARLGHPGILSYKEAEIAYNSCLEDFQQMLVDRANDIQRQFNELSASIEERQTKFELIRESLSPSQIDKYYAEISEANFALRVFEARLDRHQELAHSRYLALETWLNLDKRLRVLRKKR